MNPRDTQSTSQSGKSFIDIVQEHERAWGTETYQERPGLAEILNAAVVAFWQKTDGKEKRLFITLHSDTKDIESHLAKLVLRSSVQTPDRRYIMGFQGQKRLKITGFKIMFTTE